MSNSFDELCQQPGYERVDDRERVVLYLRFGPNPQTLKFIGDLMLMSRERIRRIEQDALAKLSSK